MVEHNGGDLNLRTIVHSLELRVLEHISTIEDEKVSIDSPSVSWKPPPSDLIKLNVDVALSVNTTSISVVARDHKGEVLKAWTNNISAKDPTIAEASAIRWALELVIQENYLKVIVESDAKNCVDNLNGQPEEWSWKISSLCNDSLDFALHFVSCSFCWTKREANTMAHFLAKFALHLISLFCYKKDILPPFVL